MKAKILSALITVMTICTFFGAKAYAEETQITETTVSEAIVPEETITAEDERNGWLDEDGKHFCYSNGEPLTGYQIIDGKEYYFAANGAAKSGFQTINGIRMYFSYDSFERQFGWIEQYGDMFYLNEDGKAIGRNTIDGKDYIFSEYGACMTGWFEYDGSKYYSDMESGLYTGECEIEGEICFFSPKGRFKSGFVTVDDKRFFYDYDSLKILTGFIDHHGNRYYCDSSEGKLVGDNTIDGIVYRFDEFGCQQYGFQKFSDGTRYYSNTGQPIKGLLSVNGNTFYFGSDYLMRTGFQSLNGKKYYFDNNGIMQTGLQTINGNKYYFGSNGVMQTGFQTINGNKYYFGSSGIMQTGFQTINGNKYYFGSNGVMQTGFQTINGNKYYFGSSGVMQTGFQTISGKKYCFGNDGIMMTGWQRIDGKYYFLGKDGVLQEKTPKVFVGIGHGGYDPGAIGYIVEKEYTFATGQEVARLLKEAGIEFMLSRDRDMDTTMESKLELCNDYDPDLIIDIHFNAVGGNGFEVYHSQYGGMSLTLAENINNEVSKIMKSNGCKIMLYPNGTDRFTIIRETHAPSVLLEGGYVDDYYDAEFIRKNYKRLAKAYVEGVLKTLDIIMKSRE